MSELPRLTFEDRTLCYSISTKLYPLPALFRTCYWFTDSCFIYFTPGRDPDTVTLRIAPKESGSDPQAIAGEFLNALLDQTLRHQIAEETAAIRTLVYAQAFAEVEDFQTPLPSPRDGHE